MELREPCQCGSTEGTIIERNGQDTVWCDGCHKWKYNAPRVETGKKQRSVSTVREGISTKLRNAVIQRASCRCEMCGARDKVLHVDHAISIHDGVKAGLTEQTLNHIDNLLCLCEECNLGKGKKTMPIHIMVGIFAARLAAQS